MLFDAMARAPGGPTRHGVGAQLAARFDAHGALSNVPRYWYRVEADGQPALQPR
jgi:hypothetical protein